MNAGESTVGAATTMNPPNGGSCKAIRITDQMFRLWSGRVVPEGTAGSVSRRPGGKSGAG